MLESSSFTYCTLFRIDRRAARPCTKLELKKIKWSIIAALKPIVTAKPMNS